MSGPTLPRNQARGDMKNPTKCEVCIQPEDSGLKVWKLCFGNQMVSSTSIK